MVVRAAYHRPMLRSVIGFLVSIVLAVALLVPTWVTFPTSAMPWNLQYASFEKMERATRDLEAYPFLTVLDERVQAASWRAWIDDRSAKSEIFLIGANRMTLKLAKLSAAVFGGILLAFVVRWIAKAVFSRVRGYSRLTGRLALILMGAFVLSFLLPVVIANHPGALLYSVPLLVGFVIASTGKDPQAAQQDAQVAPIPYGVGPFGPPPGHGAHGGQGAYPGYGASPGGQGAYPGGQGAYPGGQVASPGGPGPGPQGGPWGGQGG